MMPRTDSRVTHKISSSECEIARGVYDVSSSVRNHRCLDAEERVGVVDYLRVLQRSGETEVRDFEGLSCRLNLNEAGEYRQGAGVHTLRRGEVNDGSSRAARWQVESRGENTNGGRIRRERDGEVRGEGRARDERLQYP